MTTQSHVTALAAVPSDPLLAHDVIVQPVVVQLVPFPARSQRVMPATHPGLYAGAPPTTALIAKALLFVRLESPGFDIFTLNVTLLPLAAVAGMTGILTVSLPMRAATLVVFVQVTHVPT